MQALFINFFKKMYFFNFIFNLQNSTLWFSLKYQKRKELLYSFPFWYFYCHLYFLLSWHHSEFRMWYTCLYELHRSTIQQFILLWQYSFPLILSFQQQQPIYFSLKIYLNFASANPFFKYTSVFLWSEYSLFLKMLLFERHFLIRSKGITFSVQSFYWSGSPSVKTFLHILS